MISIETEELHPKVASRVKEYLSYIERLVKQNDQVKRADRLVARFKENPGAHMYLGTPTIWVTLDVNAFSELAPAIRLAYALGFRLNPKNRFTKEPANGAVRYHFFDVNNPTALDAALVITGSLKVGANGCKRVKVGEETIVRPIYEIRCGSPTDLPDIEES